MELRQKREKEGMINCTLAKISAARRGHQFPFFFLDLLTKKEVEGKELRQKGKTKGEKRERGRERERERICAHFQGHHPLAAFWVI